VSIFIFHIECLGNRNSYSVPGRWFDEAYGIWKKKEGAMPFMVLEYAEAKVSDGQYLTVIPAAGHPLLDPPLCLRCGRVPKHSESDCERNCAEDRVRQTHRL